MVELEEEWVFFNLDFHCFGHFQIFSNKKREDGGGSRDSERTEPLMSDTCGAVSDTGRHVEAAATTAESR